MTSANKISHSTLVSACLITGQAVTPVLQLGQHAYADTFIGEDQINLSEPVFPLQVCLCPESGSLQLGYVSSAKDRYGLYDYSYTSSNSATARAHWDEYATTVKSRLPTTKFAVEIGSNDGYLIDQFQGNGVRVLGIDPSAEMCRIARERGVEVMPAMFCEPVAKDLAMRSGQADLIMANNVFNHANDPVSFARAVATLLSNDGVFVFEVPYWLSMIESGRFTDMVYHEHPTYFTVKMVWNMLKTAGLEITDFDVVNYHGGSLRVFARRHTGMTMPVAVEDAMARETQIGLFDARFYQVLQRRFEQQRDAWLHEFYRLRLVEPDAVFIGVGAAAKANTWLTWHGLNRTHLKYVTDASAFKQGKYTPLTRIPIADDSVFAEHERPYAVILSWNIGQGLRQAILNINPRTRFLSQ
jgi:SAM-dependent methyltransferase